MAKMFYTTEEAAQKLGVNADALKQLVSQNKLREFRDGARVMFKVDQVDRIAGEKSKTATNVPGLSDSGIPLGGPGASGTDVISLSDSAGPAATSKEDTVVTGQGVQVFGKGEVKPADAAAQTRIQSAIDDQLSLEGVGSGSGLLDLTRESDDTSLGAELLDEIYPGGEKKGGDSGIASSSGIFEQTAAETSGPSGLEHIAGTTAGAPVEYVEARDSTAGAFGGMALASSLIMLLVGGIALAAAQGYSPGWLDNFKDTQGVLILTVAMVLISALFAGVGFFVGKASTR